MDHWLTSQERQDYRRKGPIEANGLAEVILFELKAINRRLDLSSRNLPVMDKTWLTPGEMSKICGVSTRTLQNYINNGKLSYACYKKEQQGLRFRFLYHRELVMRELGMKDP